MNRMQTAEMNRQTKIVATLGPATDGDGLAPLLAAGVNVVRLNFSHGSADEHRQRAEAVRREADRLNTDVAILVDLQGPKIRIGKFLNGAVELQDGDPFVLDADMDLEAGTDAAVGLTYKSMPDDVNAGDTLLLDDGRIAMVVDAVKGKRISCTVSEGGRLSNNKGVNRLGGGLSAPALTDKDRKDIRLAAELAADYVAVSFPREAQDMHKARYLLEDAGSHARLVAKIERAEAIEDLDDIILASDAVMVARGDLGVEISDAELPGVQKRIIARSRELNRLVITATQMMESMISSPIPTRAEVLDVANAVIDGTDAVMLSAETAAGKYPVKAVEAVHRVCLAAQRHETIGSTRAPNASHFERSDEAIAMATAYTARHMGADAIVALTESGDTALWMSRVIPGMPIFALTRHEGTRRRMALCRGVAPVAFDPQAYDPGTVVAHAIEHMAELGLLASGQRVIVTKGDATGPGGTNTLKIISVP